MSIREIKEEIYYYADRKATDEEAQEIAMYYNNSCGASLDEIISDYYNC